MFVPYQLYGNSEFYTETTENDDSSQKGLEKLVGGEFYGMGPVAGEDGENDEDGNLGEELNKPSDPVDDENANLEDKLRKQQKEG